MTTQITPAQRQTTTDEPTGSSQTVTFGQFDPSLGTLDGIGIGLTAKVTGDIAVENLEAAPSRIAVSLLGTAILMDPGGGVVTSASAAPTASVNLSAYDNSIDFAGASGMVLTGLSATGGTTAALQPTNAAFVGTGSVPLTVNSTGQLHVAGPANLQIATVANVGAGVSLQYAYVPQSDYGNAAQASGVLSAGLSSQAVASAVALVSASNPGPSSTTASQTFTFADRTTGWTDSLAIRQFDPTLGTLEAVNVTLSGNILASVAADDGDPTGGIVVTNQTATLSLQLPATTVPVAASVSDRVTLTGSGAGASHIDSNLAATGTTYYQLADTADLAALTGHGSVVVPISATGTGTLDGPGNLEARLLAEAGGTVTVSYLYSPAVFPVAGSAVDVACFVAGTRIATEHGEVAVEHLCEGDRVQVVLGQSTETVAWIGYRHLDCSRHPEPRHVWPVRIAAGAFGAGRPYRDLLLSPDHAIYFNEVLIPVKHLINGTSIAQVRLDAVSYYHVQLPRHSVLLAEGLPVESYLDTKDGSNFANGGKTVALHPNFASRVWEAAGCAPLVVTGPDLDAARRWINGNAPGVVGQTWATRGHR